MARTESALTTRGVELIRQRQAAGAPPALTETARLLGIDKSTLIRACQRAGITLPRGRPPSTS